MGRSATDGGSFRVGDWLIHPEVSEVVGAGGVTRLEAKPMAVLVELASRAGRVVSREDLLAAVWGDSFVTEEVLTHSVWELRRALGDDARNPTYLQTVPRRGYRLIAPVVWLDEDAGAAERWEIGEQIGGGAMGLVYRARDHRLQRRVALKFLPREWSQDPVARRQLLREARAAAALDHPNVCPVYEVGETGDGQMFLVMALYEGETLRERLRRGPLSVDQALGVAAEVAAGLGAAHAQGIIHRDVKPSNVFLTSHGEAKLLDFGVARLPGVTTLSPASSPGTPAYMSPEQCRGDAVDARSDLWSLGVLLYEMIAGLRPFGGDHDQAIIYSILNRQPEPLVETRTGLPAEVSALAERLLAKDPAGRPESAGQLHRELVRVMAGGGAAEELRAAPTGIADPKPEVPARLDPSAPGVPAVATSVVRRRWWRWSLPLAVSLALVVSVRWWWSAEGPVLRVAVPSPVIEGDDPAGRLHFAAAAAHSTVLDELAALPRMAPLSAEYVGETPGDPMAISRAAAADEVVQLLLREASGVGLVTFRRVRGKDGVVLWSDSFAVPMDPADALLVRDAVRQRLWQAFPDHRRFAETSSPAVSAEDYVAFLELRQQVEEGSGDLDRRQLLDRMATIVESSPRFLQGHIAMADLARSLFTSTGDRAFFTRAMASVEAASDLAPDDPRPLIWRTRLLLEDRQAEPARAALERARRLAPGHPSIPLLETSLADLDGHPEQARQILSKAVAAFPSWQNLYRLAALEHRDGLADAARGHLEEALVRSPGNSWVLRKLGSLELSQGRLGKAEDLFAKLIERDPQVVSSHVNLGLVRFLQGRYDEAAAVFEEVLAAHPDHATAWLDLADAQLAAGRTGAARDSYQRVVELLDRDELPPTEAMLRAQALAHLGRSRAAIHLTQDTVEANPEHAEVLYLAAVVYSVAGDRTSAVVAAERAHARGMEEVWFRTPAFDGLREDPGFQALFAAAPRR